LPKPLRGTGSPLCWWWFLFMKKKPITFRWVGRNKHFDEITIQENITTDKLLNGDILTFFSKSNRGKARGTCEFISEDLLSGVHDKNGKPIYANDIIDWDGEVFLVIYNDCTACFDVMYSGGDVETLYTLDFEENTPELIGNAYKDHSYLSSTQLEVAIPVPN